MTEWQVFGVVVSMFGFVATMYTMFYKPTHELKIEIVKLTSEIVSTRKENELQDSRIEKNEERLEKHEHMIDKNKIDIIHIKNQLFVKDRESH